MGKYQKKYGDTMGTAIEIINHVEVFLKKKGMFLTSDERNELHSQAYTILADYIDE